jgi:DNA polymerase elongation subunit (family B)
MEHSIEQFWYKLWINSRYPIIGHVNFTLHDPQVAEGVTSTGNKILKSVTQNAQF